MFDTVFVLFDGLDFGIGIYFFYACVYSFCSGVYSFYAGETGHILPTQAEATLRQTN